MAPGYLILNVGVTSAKWKTNSKTPGPVLYRYPSLSSRWFTHTEIRLSTLGPNQCLQKVRMSKERISSYHARGKALPATVDHVATDGQSGSVSKFWKIGVSESVWEELRHRWHEQQPTTIWREPKSRTIIYQTTSLLCVVSAPSTKQGKLKS